MKVIGTDRRSPLRESGAITAWEAFFCVEIFQIPWLRLDNDSDGLSSFGTVARIAEEKTTREPGLAGRTGM